MTWLHNSLDLPSGFILRRATAKDTKTILEMVYAEFLDPTQLHWANFWVIEYSGCLVACGQLRSFFGVQEIGSLVVKLPWRGRGLGTILVKHLIQQATQPLYLTCGDRLASFYARLGFVPISWFTLSCHLRLKFVFPKIISILRLKHLAIMQYRSKV